MHDTITIGVPVLAILFGILLNLRGLKRLENRLDRMQSELTGRIDAYRRIWRSSTARLGEHEAKIDTLMHREAKP